MAEARQWETASGKHQEEKAGKGSVFKLRERQIRERPQEAGNAGKDVSASGRETQAMKGKRKGD